MLREHSSATHRDIVPVVPGASLDEVYKNVKYIDDENACACRYLISVGGLNSDSHQSLSPLAQKKRYSIHCSRFSWCFLTKCTPALLYV
jgi:hypothetical protein